MPKTYRATRRGPIRDRSTGASPWALARFGVFLAFLAASLLGGGSARADVQSLLYLRPAAVLCIGILLLLPGRLDWRPLKSPLLLLGALALLMILQLIPLSPSLWPTLPGHALFAEAATVAGMPQPWRPISVTPDLTLNSLVSLVVPLATLVGIASIRREHRALLLVIIIVASLVSALIGLVQVTGGAASNLRFYRITNRLAAVGLFANRNHQAALLACTLPMLVAWVSLRQIDWRTGYTRLWVSLCVGIFLVPMILVTGSRAGLALAALGLCGSWLLFGRNISIGFPPRFERWKPIFRLVPWVVLLSVGTAAVFASRAEALRRLISEGYSTEARATLIPTFIDLASTYFPVGSGFGSFDPVFRIVEPLAELRPTYLNHAHNDLFELAITGGAGGVVLLLLLLLWWAGSSFSLMKAVQDHPNERQTLGRLGSLIAFLLLVASLVDYPLRTPMLGVFFAISVGWICFGRDRADSNGRRDAERTT